MKTFDELIKDWARIASHAVSGGNSQPWKIEYGECRSVAEKGAYEVGESLTEKYFFVIIKCREIYLENISPLDVKGGAYAISIGSFVTNLIYAAESDGYKVENEKIVLGSSLFLTSVRLEFIKNYKEMESKEVVNSILSRSSNRFPFLRTNLSKEYYQSLEEESVFYKSIKIFIFSDKKSNLMNDFLKLEKIRWKSKEYLHSLLDEISFSKVESNYQFKIPHFQLGLNRFDQLLFKLLKKSPFFQFLIRHFLYAFVARKSLIPFIKDCSGIVVIQGLEMDFITFYQMGQYLQKIWLKAIPLKIGIQPLGTAFVALRYWSENFNSEFSKQYGNIIENTTHRFINRWNLDLKKPIFLFRVGYELKKNAQSPRADVMIQKIETSEEV